MKSKVVWLMAIALLSTSVSLAGDNDEKREKSRKMVAQTIEDLYKLEPTAKAAVQQSAGYAVFNNMGAHVLLLSTARGAGVAVNSKSKQEPL